MEKDSAVSLDETKMSATEVQIATELEEHLKIIQKVKSDLKNPEMNEPNYRIMMNLLPKFKGLVNTSKDASVILDLVETMLGLLSNLVEKHKSLIPMRNDMSTLLVFIILPLCFKPQTEEFICAMLKNIQKFLDLTSDIPRTVLYAKMTLSKVSKLLIRKLMSSKTYWTQAKIVGLLVRMLEDVGEKLAMTAMEQIRFHHKEKTNGSMMNAFLAIKSADFTKNCRIFLNKLNAFASKQCNIFSVQGKLKRINNIQLADDQIEKIWIDFHATCLTFSFSSTFKCFSMDSDSSELYHVEVETYDVFEAGKVTPAKSFEMIVHPVSCKILDSAEKAVDNIEIRDFVLELEDQEIKIEAFEKLIFGMFQSRTKLPERAESSVTMADNESMFSFGTFKTSMTPASRIPKQQFGTDSSVIITDQKLPTPQLRSQMDTPLRDNLENEKPKTGKIAEIEKKLQVIQEESGSPLKPQSKPEKFIMLQNVLREIQKEQPHQKIADQTRKFIEDDKKKQMDLAENKENFQKDRSNNQANNCKNADPQKMAENVVEIIDLISQDPIENAVNRKSEDLFSTDPQVFPRTKTQTTDAQANPTKSRETDKIFVKQEEISAELGETGNSNQIEGGNLRNPDESRENPGDSREIPAKQGTPNDPRKNGGNFEEIAETRGSQRVATQIEADIRNLREIQENASVLKQNNQRELRKKPEMKIHEQSNTKQTTENRIFSQPKPTARRSARRKPVKIDEYSFDDTDDDLELQPFRSKRTMSEEKEEIPAKRARKTEDTTKNKRASKTKNCNENISSFIVPKRPARKQTKTQTKNEKVEKTDANGKKSVTMVKTSKKSTIKRGFSDLSSLGSGYEDAGKRNTVNYRRQSVTKVEYEIEEFDDAAEPRSAGNGMTLTGGSKKTGGIKNIAQNSAKIPKITTRSPKVSSKQGRIIGIPKNPRTPANVPKSSNIASKTPGLRQENAVAPPSPMQLNSKTQEHHQEARKRPANEDFAVPGPSGYRPPTKIHRSCNIEKETAVPASKNRDGIQKHEILKQNFVASSSVAGVRYNLNALEKNPLLRTFLDSVASQDPQNNTDLYGSEDFGQCETRNQENEETRGKIPERKNPPEKQVIEHDIPQHTYTIQKHFVPQMKAPAPEPVEPTKNVQVMDVEPENPPEICDSLQHTYTIQKNFEPQMNVPVEPTKNVRFTEKIEIVSDKTGHTIQYKKTAEYSSEESGFGMIKGLERADGERFPAIDQYKEELKESYLQILEQNEAKLKSIELNPEQFQIAQIQEKFKNFLNLQKSLNIEIPIFIDMLKHLQAQRQKVIVMKEKQTVILNDLLKMKMENLEVLKSLAKKFNETIDISIEDGQKALDEAQKKIWKNFMVQAFAKLSEEVAKYY